MTKDIQILKFSVRRDGVDYGPGHPDGAVIYDLPTDEADKLIAESNETIVELPKREAVQTRDEASKVRGGGRGRNKPDEKVANDVSGAGAADTGASDAGAVLPGVNPSDTVK
jgi:hypothetical protein